MTTALHRHLLDRLIRDGWSHNRGWKDAVRKAVGNPAFCGENGFDAEEILGEFDDAHLQPDAYRLLIEGYPQGWLRPCLLVIEMAEVIVTHPLSPAKLRSYEDLWWACDSSDFVHFRLYVINRDGDRHILANEHPWKLAHSAGSR